MIIGGGTWAFGSRVGNMGGVTFGRGMVLAGFAGAFVVGAAAPIVNLGFGLGVRIQLVHQVGPESVEALARHHATAGGHGTDDTNASYRGAGDDGVAAVLRVGYDPLARLELDDWPEDVAAGGGVDPLAAGPAALDDEWLRVRHDSG